MTHVVSWVPKRSCQSTAGGVLELAPRILARSPTNRLCSGTAMVGLKGPSFGSRAMSGLKDQLRLESQ